MSARIARGTVPRGRPKSKSAARGKQGRGARAHVDEGLRLPDAVRKLSWLLFLFMLAALALALASAFGLPQMAGRAIGEAAGNAGFQVNRYEIRGLDKMQRRRVDAIAETQLGTAMPLVDLDGTRAQLLRFGWVQDARVSRRLPDTLVVDIVERKPAAIWQHKSQLALIDRDGVLLEPVKLEAMPDLPLVIGPAANRHVTALNRLIRAAPHLKPMLAGASWIGERRWDLRFQSGEILSLPEGEVAARKALSFFARTDQASPLLGRGYVRFYMLVPGKLIVRISREPGSIVPVLAPEPAPDDSVDPSTTI